MRSAELLPFVGEAAIRRRAGEHRRDILVAVASEPGTYGGDFEHQFGVLLGIDQELPDIVRDALERQGAQLTVLGRDRPGIARATEADAVLGSIVPLGVEC